MLEELKVREVILPHIVVKLIGDVVLLKAQAVPAGDLLPDLEELDVFP